MKFVRMRNQLYILTQENPAVITYRVHYYLSGAPDSAYIED